MTTPVANSTHDIVLGGVGFFTEPRSLQRFNATRPLPRFSISQDSRPYSDFSELETWGQNSFHHGRGQLFARDPAGFMDSSADTRIKSQVMLAALRVAAYKTGGTDPDFNGSVAKFFWYNNNWYALVLGTAAATNALYIWDNTNTEFDTVAAGLDTTSGTPMDAIAFGGDLFIAQGEAVVGRTYDTSAAAWEAMDVPADYLIAWNNLLWRADNINEVYWSANPGATTPVWSGPVYIGDTNVLITHLGIYNNRVVVGKGDSFWSLEPSGTGYLPVPVADFSTIFDANNLKGHDTWQGNYYYNVLFGINRFDGASQEPMGPDRGAHLAPLALMQGTPGQVNPILPEAKEPSYDGYAQYGRLTSLKGTQNWLYGNVDGGTANKSSIYAYGGAGWHYIYQTAAVNSRIRQIGFSPANTTAGILSKPCLWWSEVVGTAEAIYYMVMPEGTENPDDYTGYAYAASGDLTTSWFDYNLPGIDKNFVELEVRADKCVSTAQYITVSYQKDGIDTWITPGWTVAYSPTQTFLFPEGTTCKRIRLKFSFATTSSTKSPILRGYGLRFLPRPDVKYGWKAGIRTADNIPLLGDQGKDTNTGKVLSDYLWSFLDHKLQLHLSDGRMLTATTNLITNPSLEIDTNADGTCDGVTVIGSPTLSQSLQWASRGLRSQKAVTGTTGDQGFRQSATVVAATQYVVCANVYTESGDRVTVQAYDGSNSASISTLGTVSAWSSGAKFTRVTGVVTSPAGCTSLQVRTFRATGDATQATTFYVDAVMVAAASADTPYIDGDGPRCSWTGTPHASTSTRDSTYLVNLTSIGESYSYRPSDKSPDETVLPIQLVEL